MAETKGFFRSEGLENETIVIPGSTAIAAFLALKTGAVHAAVVNGDDGYKKSDRI